MKRVLYGKIVLVVIVFLMSYRGELNHYLDGPAFILPLLFGTIIRLVFTKGLKTSKYQEYASFSYILAGMVWTVFWGFVLVVDSERINVLIWLPIFYGTILSVCDDLVFRRDIVVNDVDRLLRIKRKLGVIILFGGTLIYLAIHSDLSPFWLSYIDAPSLFYIVIVVIPMLVISEHGGDVLRGFKLILGPKQFELTTKELISCRNGFDLAIKGVYLASVISVMLYLPNVFVDIEIDNLLSAKLSIMILTPLYGFFINTLLYSVRGKITKEIVYREI